MWVTSITMAGSKEEKQDSAGFVSESTEKIIGIPANCLDATRNDEILANESGYTADVIMEIEAAAYNGQSSFMDEATGDWYDIRRTFRKNKSNRIQLTGELREHGKI